MVDDFIVVGAGPAGLNLALAMLENGFDVKLYDSESRIGIPQHCSGVVSKSFVDKSRIPSKLITNQLYGVEMDISGYKIRARASIPKAYVIKRYEYEVWLAEKYLDINGSLILGKSFNEVYHGFASDGLVVDATGAVSYIRRNYGGFLPALQYVVKLSGSDLDPGIANIYVDKNFNKDFFSWAVSTGGDKWKIGTASKNNQRRILSRVISKIRDTESSGIIESRLYGHVIVGGPLSSFYDKEKNIVYIGDSAGQVKITTGGGLYYILVAVESFIESLLNGYLEYSKEFYRMLGNEFRLQKLFRNLFLKASQEEIRKVLETFSKKEVFNTLLLMGDMDFHMTSLVKLFFDRDFLKMLVSILRYGEIREIFRF